MSVQRIVNLALLANAANSQLSGDEYQSKSALSKFVKIQNLIDQGEPEVADIQFEKIMNGFKVSMKTSFEHEGDDMPNDGIDGGRRLKHIHQQGIIAPVKWVAKKNQRYSGLFEGASFGFARLSVTDFFTATGTMANPAVSLKMFRDG